MNGFTIDPSSISQSDIENDLLEVAKAMPDYEAWSVFFDSNGGRQFIKWIAGYAAMSKYEVIMARREAYPQHALNRSSKIAGAQENGYSTFRGRNAIVDVTFTPSGTGLYEKYSIIGEVKDRDLIVLSDTSYNAGIPVTVRCVIGSIDSQEVVSNTSKLAVFRFTKANVSEDFRLYIDGVEAEVTYSAIDMLKGKFGVLSNPFGSIDARYLNLTGLGPNYSVGSTIKLEYVVLKETLFVESDISIFEEEGILDENGSVKIVSLFEPIETEDSINVNSPIKSDLSNAIRGRKDQPNIFKSIDTSVLDADGDDLSAAVMILYLLKNDFTAFSAEEKEDLQDKVEPYRPFGFLPPIIKDAIRSPIKLDIKIYRQPNKTGDYISSTEAIVSAYEYKLNASLSLLDIEQSLEKLEFIKAARVSLTGNNFEINKSYELGQMVKASPDNGRIYRFTNILYFSGSVEPLWPDVNGGEIIDGGILWKARLKDDVSEIQDWSGDSNYVIGSSVRPLVANGFRYEAIEYVNKSGPIEPTWPALNGRTPNDDLGDSIHDGDLVWVMKTLEGNPSVWEPSKNYKSGDLIVATDPIDSDTDGVMFQAISYAGKTGSVLPVFPTVIGEISTSGRLQFETLDPQSIEAYETKKGQYYVITKNVTVI